MDVLCLFLDARKCNRMSAAKKRSPYVQLNPPSGVNKDRTTLDFYQDIPPLSFSPLYSLRQTRDLPVSPSSAGRPHGTADALAAVL